MQEAILAAERQAKGRGATRIHRLKLRIGQLSGVVPESLEFAFEVVGRGTLAEGAILDIERVPAAFWCARCQREFECEDFLAECPGCQEPAFELRRGREMELSSLEIS